MAGMTGERLDAILARASVRPNVFVETGTFHTARTRLAVGRFSGAIHTVELHDTWYAEAVEQLTPLGIHCHHGNSADIIPILAAEIQEPACWFCDAHWFSRKVLNVAGKDVPLPLWAELRAIAARPYADTVIVDDVHSMKTSNPTPEWLDVGLESIAAVFPGGEALIMWDQVCVWKK